jgi:hypothetical protein
MFISVGVGLERLRSFSVTDAVTARDGKTFPKLSQKQRFGRRNAHQTIWRRVAVCLT